jgi:HlyD family secretion protein
VPALCGASWWLLLLVAGCRDAKHDSTLLPGYLEADLVEIGSPEGGYLAELPVHRGQTVEAGRELFRLDPTPLDLAKQQAEATGEAIRLRAEDAALGEREQIIRRLQANVDAEQARLTLAQAEYDRHQSLIRSGGVSQSALQQSEAAYKQSRENLKALQAQLELARQGQRPLEVAALKAYDRASRATADLAAWHGAQTVRSSPEQAIVHDTLYEPGEWVAAGRPVVLLRRTSDLRARFYVSPSVLAKLRLGQEVEVILPGTATPLLAPVARIADRAEYTPPVIYSREESERLVFLVEAQLAPADAAKLHPGLPVSVRVGEGK